MTDAHLRQTGSDWQKGMTADLASHAFRLALRGLAVFPLAPGTKVPLRGSRGHLDASREGKAIRARWLKTRNANIGVATGARSDIWALDVDPQHGGDKTMARLTDRYGDLLSTVAVQTPNDGVHLWWRWPESGPEIRNSASRIGPGIDVRGEGGYVVAPPSVLSDGRCYHWIKGPTEIAKAPVWLVELTLPPPPVPRSEPKPLTGDVDCYCAAAITDELRQLEQAGENTRNDTLNRTSFAIASFVRAGAVPEDWARAILESRAVSVGLSALESRRTIASAFAAAQPREIPS
jgi:hypothetical protein